MFSNDTIDTAVIPAIVLKNMIPLPNNEIKIETINPRFVEAIKTSTSADRYVAILIHKNPLDEIWGFLYFHTNCEIICPSSVKNPVGSLIGIALNL